MNNGTWTLDVPEYARTEGEPKTNVLQFITVGDSSRAWLPLSKKEQRYVLAIPEPCEVSALLALGWVGRRDSGGTEQASRS